MLRALIDTRHPFDAAWLAYDGPRDPRADAEGLILSLAAYDNGRRPELILEGPDGEVRLTGSRQIDVVLEAGVQALALFRAGGSHG